ncbi:hypothetical protein NBH00_06855 [Paraconexibacter antarcticus]|uniref:Histidine kinase n=1 Tax=Paraconexibacter antarcticus TaxID=2949664 RepID=A0ABY5DZ97_9ACTN|nr:hypothetical protein [Paraconexibacter antarcticus]UTI65925.1 hypothetical protein NBH00_06855 [Paraconexibacter antarcticus]
MTSDEAPVPAGDRTPPNGADGRVDRTRVSLASGPMMGPVLSRLVGIYAARADLPVDRLGDALLVADTLADRAPAVSDRGRVQLSLQSEAGRLELRIGPLRPGGGQRLLDGARLPETGAVVEQLADEVRVRSGAAGGEVLIVRFGA